MIMVENHGKPELPIGCSVYTFGAGMSECDGVVISESNEHGAQKCVTVSDYESEQRFFTIDQYSRPLSKKFGIGVYYDDELTVSYSSEQIADAIAKAEIAEANREAAATKKAEAYAAAKVAVVNEYPHLTPLTSSYDKKATKANLVAVLKHEFPGIYFSIRCTHGYSYQVTWENGPTVEEVREQTNKFKNSYFDGMTDSTVHYDNAFADVFGSLDYIDTTRKMSDDVRAFMPMDETVNYITDETRDFTNAFHKQPFPPAAKITGYDKATETFSFTTPERTRPTGDNGEATEAGEFTIEHYSEKSFIVRGETYEIRDKMKSLGGVWLRHIKCWCYSYRKLDEVKAALGIG